MTDLNFSHSEQALLACVDEAGYLYVYEIDTDGEKVRRIVYDARDVDPAGTCASKEMGGSI